MKPLGLAFSDARCKLGLSLREVSLKAGCSSVYLSEIERCVKEPSATILVLKIASILGISEDECMKLCTANASQNHSRMLALERRVSALEKMASNVLGPVYGPPKRKPCEEFGHALTRGPSDTPGVRICMECGVTK